MKNLNDLMTLITKCLEQNGKNGHNHWFVDFSGHVSKLSLRLYRVGWTPKTDDKYEECNIYLTEEGIQEAYWFLANRV